MHTNFEIMHYLIYDQFLEASIYTELIETKMYYSEGNIVDMVRLLIKYKLILPNYLFIVDKVGLNLY